MRSDLAKLTTEKERRSWYPAKKYGGKVRIVHDPDHDYDNEYGGFYSSARRGVAHGWNHKEFSDVLNPMIGALRKNVGRPWNDVYSEFCQFLDRRSLSGIHIFGHLCGRGGEVTVSGLYVGEDGEVYEHQPYSLLKAYRSKVDGFYVHPETGILCYKERSRYKYPSRELVRLRENDVRIGQKNYKLINGLWFEVWYEKKRDMEFRACWTQTEKPEWYRDRGYIQSRKGVWGNYYAGSEYDSVYKQRSLNGKEIKMVKKFQVERIKELE